MLSFCLDSCLLHTRNEIDTLMGKYVGQEHTMYLKVCSLVEIMEDLAFAHFVHAQAH